MAKLLLFLMPILFSCDMISSQQNTMTLDELLNKQREQYMATYKLGLSQNKTDKSAIEVMLQTTTDQNRHLPEVYQLTRYDLINISAEGKYNLTEFNLDKDSVLKYDKHTFEFEGMKVEIMPFIWNGCEFTLVQKPNITLENWAKKWLDIEDKKSETSDGFLNVIHSLTYPEEKNGSWTISVDFGSSSIDTFKELLSLLSKQGNKEVKVYSKSFLD